MTDGDGDVALSGLNLKWSRKVVNDKWFLKKKRKKDHGLWWLIKNILVLVSWNNLHKTYWQIKKV